MPNEETPICLGPTLRLLRNSAHVERWPGLVTPSRLSELGSQGHAAVICWVLGRSLEQNGRELDWDLIIGRLISRLYRVSILAELGLQDPSRVSSRKRDEERIALDNLVELKLGQLAPENYWLPEECRASCGGQSERMHDPIRERSTNLEETAQILASLWELRLIESSNQSNRIDEIRMQLTEILGNYSGFARLQDALEMPFGLLRFVDQTGSLRFTLRRLPGHAQSSLRTLEHSTLVAVASFLSALRLRHRSEESYGGAWTLYHVFYGGLFNRLHEWLTSSTSGRFRLDGELGRLVEDARLALFLRQVSESLPYHCSDELDFWLREGFRNKCWPPDGASGGAWWPESRNNAFYGGRLVESCECLWDFLEACEVLEPGRTSDALRTFVDHLYTRRAELARSGANFTVEFDEAYSTIRQGPYHQ